MARPSSGGDTAQTCWAAEAPSPKTDAFRKLVFVWDCTTAEENSDQNPGVHRHPNEHLKSMITWSPMVNPNADAPAGSTGTCRNAYLASIRHEKKIQRNPS